MNAPADWFREIPDEFKITVDSRVWEAKLNDSYHLGRIVKYLVDHPKREFEDSYDAFGKDLGAAILDIMEYWSECENAVDEIREVLS